MSLTPVDAAKPGTAASDARRRILEAAMRCFVENGFHNASMQQICAAAQMSPGGVYRYFASKNDIISAIFEFVHERNAQYFERMAAESATFETFAEVGFTCMRDLTEGPECQLFCEVLAEAQRNPELRDVFQRKYVRARHLLRAALSNLQARGEIDTAVDPDSVATLLMAIGDGLVVRMRLDSEMKFEAFWPAMKAMVTRMLKPAGATPASHEKVSL